MKQHQCFVCGMFYQNNTYMVRMVNEILICHYCISVLVAKAAISNIDKTKLVRVK